MHVSHRNAQNFHKETWFTPKPVYFQKQAQGCTYARKNQTDLQICGNHAVYTVQFC